jgi:hypothetical protein
MSAASGQSMTPQSAKLRMATALKHSAVQFFSPFIRWMLVKPMMPSDASVRMPAPAPK